MVEQATERNKYVAKVIDIKPLQHTNDTGNTWWFQALTQVSFGSQITQISQKNDFF